MKRILLLALLLAPSLATAQVKGIKLVSADASPQGAAVPQFSEVAVGEKHVAVFPTARQGRINLFDLDGKLQKQLFDPPVNRSAVWCDEHLYAASGLQGLNVLDKDGVVIQNIGGPRMNEIFKLAASPDGKTIFVLHHQIATLTFYDRDPKTGKLTRDKQVLQTDNGGIIPWKKLYEGRGLKLPIEKGAVQVKNWPDPSDMKVSADGNFLFFPLLTMGVGVFGKDANGWKVVETLIDNQGGILQGFGLHLSRSVEPVGKNVFVGGLKRLSWFTFDGKKMSIKKYWVDDSDPAGHDHVLPFIDTVVSLASSKNGEYLFLVGDEDGAFTVLKIGDDLELVGKVNDSPPGAKMLEVQMSKDGNRLYAKTTSSQLLVYDLDATFTK
jgi:hypothetical protein